ncbi:NAD(+) diphosphatase [Anaerocolumna sp. MB42-C2]|uniref:NAD(+) diphosphatase n=1 Tax=Anaerocolumna sp. MB42-C2 TaxID=3070997 RepID=UPI0027E04D03|nr:NAD(+) diphosphatase [Anaerocolumna sp. MB42-C2]WMJ87664.1 NAD(+) diphosphatase [Anaerocolumna sp. MB42-C2]
MINSSEVKYIPAFLRPEEIENDAWALILSGKQLLLWQTENQLRIPKIKELKDNISINEDMMYIGRYDGFACYCKKADELQTLTEKLKAVELRDITAKTGDSGLFMLAGTANHLLHWNSTNQYCGCCGNKTADKIDERAKVCPKCGNTVYPRISPATITAVFNKDQILLAHNKNFKRNLYSLIAGYVEPGETLEQCVEREIREEVGIKVKNIKYFGSQPWPFPDSLMMAFTAEYESGQIEVDDFEITDASWYHADNLPEIPNTDSVAGKMIRWYRDQFNEMSN